MRKFLALLFALLLCVATKVYAEDAATVTVTVKDLPQKLQNRTVIVTLGNGPSDTESTVIVLNGLNNYTETVTVAPSENQPSDIFASRRREPLRPDLYLGRQQLVRERDRPATALHIATAGNATREL